MYIYIYDPSAWTPNSLFNAIIVLQSFCNLCFAIFCYAIFAILQSLLCNCCYAILAMQSLLCNLCYAIFTMQSLLCNLCYAIFAFLCFLSSDCKKHYKTCAFCNILLKIMKNDWFSFVFSTQSAKNIEKLVLFAIFCWKCRKTIGFPLFFALRLQKTL